MENTTIIKIVVRCSSRNKFASGKNNITAEFEQTKDVDIFTILSLKLNTTNTLYVPAAETIIENKENQPLIFFFGLRSGLCPHFLFLQLVAFGGNFA